MPIPEKPEHLFTLGKDNDRLWRKRQLYDEFILYVDAEFERLYRTLQAQGILENTMVILTSDHGEMFERGILGHSTETLFEPIVRVPLIIFEPGRQQRLDIQQPTSAVDILPTLLHLSQRPLPAGIEGQILPPYQPNPDPARPIFAMEAKRNPRQAPLEQAATTMIIKQGYKLVQYRGHPQLVQEERISELFDLNNDPHELSNLAQQNPTLAAQLLDELESARQNAENGRQR